MNAAVSVPTGGTETASFGLLRDDHLSVTIRTSENNVIHKPGNRARIQLVAAIASRSTTKQRWLWLTTPTPLRSGRRKLSKPRDFLL
jgi:hypothetical protein